MVDTKSSKDSNDDAFNYEVERDGDNVVVRVNYEDIPIIPSIEDDPLCMAKTVDILNQVKDASQIIFFQKRDFEYEFDQIVLLYDIARLFAEFSRRKDLFSYNGLKFNQNCDKCQTGWFNEIQESLLQFEDQKFLLLLRNIPQSNQVDNKQNQDVTLRDLFEFRPKDPPTGFSKMIIGLYKELTKDFYKKIIGLASFYVLYFISNWLEVSSPF